MGSMFGRDFFILVISIWVVVRGFERVGSLGGYFYIFNYSVDNGLGLY